MVSYVHFFQSPTFDADQKTVSSQQHSDSLQRFPNYHRSPHGALLKRGGLHSQLDIRFEPFVGGVVVRVLDRSHFYLVNSGHFERTISESGRPHCGLRPEPGGERDHVRRHADGDGDCSD